MSEGALSTSPLLVTVPEMRHSAVLMLFSWPRHGKCKDAMSSWRELNPELSASRSLCENTSPLLYDSVWFSESPICDKLRTATSGTHTNHLGLTTPGLPSRWQTRRLMYWYKFSPSTRINEVHLHQPSAKSSPMPEMKYQVGLRAFHICCMNVFFSVWSMRSLNQAAITQSASVSVGREQECFAAGRCVALIF